MVKQIQKISAKGLVYKDGCIFMLKDTKGNWELPGGRVDFSEHPQDALRREFKEELNIDEVDISNIVNVWDFTVNAKGDDYHFIILVFVCSANLDEIRISDEHLEHAWIPVNEISNYPMQQGYIDSINKFIENNYD